MKFSKQDLIDGLDDEGPCRKTVHTEQVDSRRWSAVHVRVFEIDGKFYSTNYSVGLTEQQDESPYEHDDDEIECPEVFAREKTVIEYVTAAKLIATKAS